MISRSLFGISLSTQPARRRFVLGYWLVEAVALVLLFRFPMPPDITHFTAFLPLLMTLAVASNLPLLLGGFSVGGAVAFYEGRRYCLSARVRAKLAGNPEKERRMERFVQAVQPVDEREAQLRDWAYRRSHRLLYWGMYAGAVAFLLVSTISLSVLARFGFVLLELLLVGSMSLPQSLLLWTLPEPEFTREELA